MTVERPRAGALRAAMVVALLCQSRGLAIADKEPQSPETPAAAGPSRAGRERGDRAFAEQISSRRRLEVQQRTALGRQLVSERRFVEGARSLATAYALDPQARLLLEIARACQRADLDAEALAAYLQLQAEPLDAVGRAEVDEQLTVLQAKLDEPDLSIAHAIRLHLDEAKRAFFANQFALAANEYALAYTLKRLPRLLFNSAQAYRRAGRADAAYLLYQRLLDEDPASLLKKEVAAYLNELRPLAFQPPLYKRPWLWAVVGSAAALIGAGVGIGVGVTRRSGYQSTDAGVVEVTFGLQVAR